MRWVSPPEKDTATATLEKRLWDAADQFRANSGLKAQEYSGPILGLIFLRFAEVRFAPQRALLEQAGASARRGSRVDEPSAYHAAGVLYLAPEARLDYLLTLPEAADVSARVNAAMREIEKHNPLLAEVIEPFHGRILDPACGSGGMFVQSGRFVAERQRNPAAELAICGVEKTDKTGRLCRLNLAVHGLEGDIRHGGNVNSYYDDPHAATGPSTGSGHGQFDFVLANPPFNVNAVDKERLKELAGPGRRFPFGLPRTDNTNYLWIQLFYSALNARGRAGFVMANSSSDARASEQELHQPLIASRRRGRDGRRRPQYVLHGHGALHALVPGQGQGEDAHLGEAIGK